MSARAASVLGETSDARFDQEVLGAGGPVPVGARSEDAVRELTATATGVRRAGGPASVAWAPVDACALPTAEQPLREAEFTAMFATALRGTERPEPGLLRLILDGNAEVAALVRDLTARESACCSFFDFQLTAADGALTLDVRVPEARIEVLDGLACQAEAAHAGTVTNPGAIA